MYEIEFGEGWQRVDGPDGPSWWAVRDEEPEPVEEQLVIPDGYVTMGMVEG